MIFKGSQSNQNNGLNGDHSKLVCKFVFDGLGHPIGESISLENDLIIVKTDNSFLGIPLKHVETDGKKVIVKGLVDQKNAKRLGERWRRKEMKKEGYLYRK